MIQFLTRDKWFGLLALCGVLLYAGWTVYVVAADKPLDYYEYVMAAYAFTHGKNIYTMPIEQYIQLGHDMGITNFGPAYLYPILTAVIAYPLTFLPLSVGAAIWVGLSGVAALVSSFLLCTFTDIAWKRRVILAVTILFVPILTSMHAGQVNLFVLFATVLAIYWMRKQWRGWAGIALAVSIWLKPFALGIVPLWLWRREWRALGALVLTSVVINLISLALFGIAPTVSQFSTVLGVTAPTGLRTGPEIQNLNALVGRLTIGVPTSFGYIVYVALVLLVLALTALVIVRNRSGAHLAFESALVVAVVLLCAPLTWYHHLAMLLPLMALILVWWEDQFEWNPLAVTLVIAFALTDVHGLLWKPLDAISPLLANLPVLGVLLVWGVGVRFLWRARTRDLTAQDAADRGLAWEG